MCDISKKQTKPKYEVQDILNLYGDEYIKNHKLTAVQKKAITDIRSCRTSKLGYNVRECCNCSNIEFSYNSCRNRNCPKCQGEKRYKWIEDRLKTTIDTPYYHVVFTVPNQLFDIAIYNQKIFYNLLFKSASDTLKLFGKDSKYWDMKEITNKESKIDLAFFGILHTWGSTLVFHPHIHFIVAGAGISKDTILKPKYNSKFLFPVKAMSRVFRGKLVEGIKKAYYKNELDLDDRFKDSGYFESFIDHVVKRKWIVYSKAPFKSSKKVVSYMSRYTHKSAISNGRIVSIDNNSVRFRYKDYKNSNKIKTMKLSSDEFIKRFLYHILPKRYFRVRYYGLVQKLSKIKNNKIITLDTKEIQEQLNHKKQKCKKCKSTKSEVVLVVDANKKVLQGVITPQILKLKEDVFHDSS